MVGWVHSVGPRPSVRTRGFGPFYGECMKEWPEIWCLMYTDYLEKLFDFGHGLLIFLRLAQIWHSETAISAKRMEVMAWHSAC